MTGGKDSFEQYWPIEEIDGLKKPEISKQKVKNLFKKAREYAEKMNKLAANN